MAKLESKRVKILSNSVTRFDCFLLDRQLKSHPIRVLDSSPLAERPIIYEGRPRSTDLVLMASQAAALKLVLALMGLSVAGYILGPPLYWHLTEALAAVSHSSDISASSCLPCVCDCSSQPLLTIPRGIRKLQFFSWLKNYVLVIRSVGRACSFLYMNEETCMCIETDFSIKNLVL